MMTACCDYLKSSIGKKQIVAATGLFLILYVVVHLAGNLVIYAGPEVFNGYAKKLAGLRPGLYVIELALLFTFLIHMYLTAVLVFENIRSCSLNRYAVYRPVGERSWAARLMPYTGTLILGFVIWHIFDFTLTDHEGPRSIINGQSLGLYGVVYNSFRDPFHSLLYIVAMMAVGLHLSHGVQSFFQTFGFNHPRYTPAIQRMSDLFGWIIAFGYSTIPVYVWMNSLK